MSLRHLILSLCFLFAQNLGAQGGGVHDFSFNTDGPLLGSGLLTFGLGIDLQQAVPKFTEEDLQFHDPLNLNRFDRLACTQLNPWAGPASDWTLRAGMVAPVALLLLDKNTRSEAGIYSIMFAESILLTNGVTGIFKGSFQRSRPLIYNPNCDLLLKTERNARYSFFSGHASNTANYAFFAAQVFSDNNPDSKLKPFVWGTAIVLPAATGYFRFKAGKHFPTDVILGYAVGATIGWLVPHLHK